MTLRIVYIYFVLAILPAIDALADIVDISGNEKIDWNKVNKGDVICLLGERTGTIVVRKSVTIDGDCYSRGMAVLNGIVTTKWSKSGNIWRSDRSFPLTYGRHAGWILRGTRLVRNKISGIYWHDGYFYSPENPGEIRIPAYYSAIFSKNIDDLVIRNLDVRYFNTHGIRLSGSRNAVIDNVHVSWVGGAINPAGYPAAGDGITFDGNTENLLVKDSVVKQCFDTGFTIQLFSKNREKAENIRFQNIMVDRCGAGASVAVHSRSGSVIDNVDITGSFTNMGYGWSGTDNSVHGRGVMIKQYDQATITNVRLHDSLIDRFSWVGILQYSGELYAWNNVVTNGTGEYTYDKYVKPAAYTAHGMDYTTGPSDDEAIGIIQNNRFINNNTFALQLVHNRPKPSSGVLVIRDNVLKGNRDRENIHTSSPYLK